MLSDLSKETENIFKFAKNFVFIIFPSYDIIVFGTSERSKIMKKKLIIFITIISALIFTAVICSAEEFEQNTPIDIDRHWAENDINLLKSLSVMNGYDGKIYPDSNITRGEFTALIARLFDLQNRNSISFSDVKKNHIFYDSITAAAELGIINGFEDGTFRPEENITREQIMLIVSRLGGKKPSKAASFKDIKKDYIYLTELSRVYEDGIIGGYPDGSFKPRNYTTRAEAAAILIKAAKKYMPSGNEDEIFNFAYTYTVSHFSDISSAAVNSIGEARKDTYYIENTYKTASLNGYSLSNSISDISFTAKSSEGPITSYTIEYRVTRNINGDIKNYKGKSKLSIITRNGVHKVFRHDTNILSEEFINLTWEVFSSAPSKATIGVNTVSPTSFRIEDKANNSIGKIDADGKQLYFNSSLTGAYIDYARKNNYSLWVMYKTDFTLETANSFLRSNGARAEASEILTKEILKNKLDGINFDFEHMYQADRGAYTNHVKEISLMAHTLGAVVSVDVNRYEPTSSNWSMCYDRDALARYSDYIMLMAYDQYYSGSKVAGPVAGLDWTEYCITSTLKEVPSEKLVLGMPYYIRIWETKDGKVIGSKAVSMSEAEKQAKENNAEAQYDSNFRLTKYSWKKDDTEYALWMENAVSIAERVKLAKKYSLSGVASWRRGFETEDVWYAIVNEINR